MSIKFGVIGVNHNHIYGMCNQLIAAGAELVWVYAPEAALRKEFVSTYPGEKIARYDAEILDDSSIALVGSAGIPRDRAPLGIRVMQHGKDYKSDKPGFTSLEQIEQARKVQKETGRIYSICYSERFDSRATLKAGELVHAGA